MSEIVLEIQANWWWIRPIPICTIR